MLDSLNEFQPEDPAFGEPSTWPSWTDDVAVRPGRPMMRNEFLPEDLPPDQDGLQDLEF